ncbi:MAG: class I tRNA ligase family protein, partial [Defluviitaleaceae bacterium]|nr:class I tRNA ligase family protein [Defluviitaleaceae bacterium]
AASRASALWTLRRALVWALKLLHPFTPFITETLFLSLEEREETIMLSNWPSFDQTLNDPDAERQVGQLMEAVRAVRNVRAEKQVPPSQKIKIIIIPSSNESHGLFEGAKKTLAFLSGAAQTEIYKAGSTAPEKAVSAVISCAVVFIPQGALIDRDAELARLGREKKKLLQEIERVDGKLNDAGFVAKAPAGVIGAEREKRIKFGGMLEALLKQISAYE